MGNSYLRIPDPLIRKAFQEVYNELHNKTSSLSSSISVVASQAIYAAENGYNYEKLQQDLKKGVSLVFKDVTEFDQTFPTAISIGNIQLGADSVVKYGSRGVAITKNGIAGYDDSYNGQGDLPSFSLDTQGNLYLRGEVHAESGTFAGELQSPNGTFGIITAGILQNQDGSNKIDLNAADTQNFITIGFLDYLKGNGKFRLGNGTLQWDGTTLSLTSFEDTPNEVRNYDFSEGENYWIFDDGIEHSVVDYTQVSDDSPSVYMLKARNIDGSGDNHTIYNSHNDTDDKFETAENQEFTVIGYLKSDTTNHATVDFAIDYYDSSDTYLSSDYETYQVTSNWNKKVFRGTAPANSAKAQFTISLNNPLYMADGYIADEYVTSGYYVDGYVNDEYVEREQEYIYLTNLFVKKTRFGDDRVEIGAGDISFYKTLEDTPYKTLRKIEAGVANNGDTVNLTGFYDRQPNIVVGLRNTTTYKSDYSNDTQRLNIFIDDFNGDINTGEWSFKILCTISVEGKDINYDTNVQTYCDGDSGGSGSDLAYLYTKTELIEFRTVNTTKIDVRGSLTFVGGFKYQDNYTGYDNDHAYIRILDQDGNDLTGWKYLGYTNCDGCTTTKSFSFTNLDVTGKTGIMIQSKQKVWDCCGQTVEYDCSNSRHAWKGRIHSLNISEHSEDTTYYDSTDSLYWIAIG